MKVLLLGGTGAMGQYLSSLLADRGDEVFVTTRNQRTNNGNIRYITGNAHNTIFLNQILNDKYDSIIDFMTYSTEEFRNRVNILLSNTNQYIFISTCRVYADCEGVITEESPRLLDVCQDKEYLKTDEYALTKARQEDILIASEKRNWTIVRPPKTYGEGRFQLGSLEKEEWLFRVLNGKPIIFCNEIADRTLHYTNGFDLANSICALIGNSLTYGETYHVTTDNSITWRAVLKIYIDVLEEHLKRRPDVNMIGLNRFKKYSSSKYQLKYSTLLDRRFDNRKIAQFIDTKSFTTPELGLKKYLRIFFNKPYFGKVSKARTARQNIAIGESNIIDYGILLISKLKRIIKK